MGTTVDQAVELAGNRPPTLSGLLDGVPAFERACLAVESARLSEPDESAALLARWSDGVALLDALSRAKSDAEPRLIAAMTRLATAWLSPRFAGETRDLVLGRIAELRPVEQNVRQVELCEKNSEYGLTTGERGELNRLVEFFNALQAVLSSAVRSLPPRAS